MKYILIQLTVLALSFTVYSQDIQAPFSAGIGVSKPQVIFKDDGEGKIFDVGEVDKLPTYYFDDINGVFNYRISKEIENKLKQLVAKKKQKRRKTINSELRLSFVVKKDGKIGSIKTNHFHDDINYIKEEIIKAIGGLDYLFDPAVKDGKKVATWYYELSIDLSKIDSREIFENEVGVVSFLMKRHEINGIMAKPTLYKGGKNQFIQDYEGKLKIPNSFKGLSYAKIHFEVTPKKGKIKNIKIIHPIKNCDACNDNIIKSLKKTKRFEYGLIEHGTEDQNFPYELIVAFFKQ
ncbi:hypothetical protein [uncultured Aquimarina sp.]|uniref:hypothetical protein n=1 Tax=uncultured Aquimarina sp. TaxID=575652 RepID=UPI002616A456|nr:hypothetical protein [uncultured Aquimarina sp.]